MALLALGGCDGGGRDLSSSTPSPRGATSSPAPEVDSFETRVVADFSVSPARPGTELSTVQARTLQGGRGSAVIFAVARPGVPARCIAGAALRTFVEGSSGEVADELAVYPSHVFDAPEKEDGDAFGYSGSLLDSRPRATTDDTGGGWVEWDVTDVVKLWTGGGAFPSRGMFVPERGPIVLALRDVDLADPFATVRIASADAPESRPHVAVTVRKECRGS